MFDKDASIKELISESTSSTQTLNLKFAPFKTKTPSISDVRTSLSKGGKYKEHLCVIPDTLKASLCVLSRRSHKTDEPKFQRPDAS